MTLNGFAIAVIKLAQREQHVGVVFNATVTFVLNVNHRVPLPITFEATVKVKGQKKIKNDGIVSSSQEAKSFTSSARVFDLDGS